MGMVRRDGRAPKSSRTVKSSWKLKVTNRHWERRLRPEEVLSRIVGVLLPLLLLSLAKDFCEKTLMDTCRFLAKASAQRTTLNAARENARKGRSRRHMWRVLEFLNHRKLQRAITITIRKQVKPWLPKGLIDLAIDLHLIPYCGITRLTSMLLRSKAQRGTNRFHGYSTAYITHNDHRLTIGCRWLWTRKHLVRVIENHIRDVEAVGLRVRRLLLDREFYCYEVLAFLRMNGYSYIMPPRAGERMTVKWKRGRRSHVTRHTVNSGNGRTIDVTVQVVVRYKKGKVREEKGIEYLFYVVGGDILPHKLTRELYSRRFGVETCYLVAESARPRTNSHDPTIRFLLFAIAIIIENEWVIMKIIYASERRMGRRGYVVKRELLRFRRLTGMLLTALRRIYGEVEDVSAEGPPPGWVEVCIMLESGEAMAND